MSGKVYKKEYLKGKRDYRSLCKLKKEWRVNKRGRKGEDTKTDMGSDKQGEEEESKNK